MQIETCFNPISYSLFHQKDNVVVMIDILRASSAITTAFYHGVAKMIPVSGIDEAQAYKKNGYIVAAERNAEIVEGFDMGNSPFSYMGPRLKGKTIVITTTNGTLALEASRDAYKTVIGSFLNMQALTSYLAKHRKNVLFLCAGWKNKFNLEDSLFAGAVAEALTDHYNFETSCDSTLAS